MEIKLITSCRPTENLNSFFETNRIVDEALNTKNCQIIIFNHIDELPKEIIEYPSIKVIDDFIGDRPSVTQLFTFDQNSIRLVCNADVEIDLENLFLKVSRLGSFDIASGQRRDYEELHHRNKKQSKQTLDYFLLNNTLPDNFLKSLKGFHLGDIRVDNAIIHNAYIHHLEVLDLSNIHTIYHKNHEDFKISGFFNLVLKISVQNSFQENRNSKINFTFGSLWYANKIIKLPFGVYYIYRLPEWLNRILYKLSRLINIVRNRIEVILSKWLIKSNKKIKSYSYFLIHFPKYE